MQPVRAALWCLLAGCLLLVGCAHAPGRLDAQPPSEHQAELSALASLGLIDLPEAHSYLNALLQKLLAGANVADAPAMRVSLNSAAGLHAHARLDGHIYLNWGALDALQSEDELAALLAHEASHILRQHQALDQSTAWIGPLSNIGALLASGTPLGAATLLIGGQYADRALAAGWSRAQELEADQLGLDLLTRAGYPASAYVDLFERLDQHAQHATPAGPLKEVRQMGAHTEYKLDLFDLHFGRGELSHPAYEERRAALRPHIQRAMAQPAAAAAGAMTGPDGLLALRQQARVAAALTALHGAAQARRGGTPAPQAAQLARQALASPVGNSFVVRLTALVTLPPAELAALQVPPLQALALDREAPIVAPAMLMGAATQRHDWAEAVRLGDLIRERYDYPDALYPLLIRSYEHRARQIVQQMPTPQVQASVALQFELLGEQARVHGVALKLRGRCMGSARDMGQLLQCE